MNFQRTRVGAGTLYVGQTQFISRTTNFVFYTLHVWAWKDYPKARELAPQRFSATKSFERDITPQC